jgi:hypothetical protein
MPEGPWVLVIGCHRSGTSAVTGALVALGLQGVAPGDRMDRLPSNPEHWESLGAALLNEDLLERVGGAWDAPPPEGGAGAPVPSDDGLADPAAVMATAYPGQGPLVWKDPRACLLLPYWRRRLPGPLTAVFVWREPLEVARSLHTRDGMPLVDGLALWERYNREAAEGLAGVDTYVVRYEDVLADPEGTLGDVAAWLGDRDRFADAAPRWDVAAAAATVDRGLHHESADDGDGLPDLHRPVAEWLAANAGGHTPLATVPSAPGSPWFDAVLDTRREVARFRRRAEALRAELDREVAEHRQVVAMLEALVQSRDVRVHVLTSDLEGERQRYEDLRAELGRLKASTSWRVTAPLRAALARLSGTGGD